MPVSYTYLWLREDGTPYYAGKGIGRRAFYKLSHRQRPPEDKTRIILQEWVTESEAFEAEVFLIDYFGRVDLGTGCLRNLTDGGEGRTNIVVSEETKQKMSVASKGRQLSCEHRQKLRVAITGKKRSVEHCLKIGLAKKGKTLSEEHKDKIRLSMKRAASDPEIRMRLLQASQLGAAARRKSV